MPDVLSLTIRYSVIPDESVQVLDVAAGPLLQAGLTQSLADGIYFYRVDRNRDFLDLVSSRGLPVVSVPSLEVLLSPEQLTPDCLPEFAQNRFGTAIAMPLRNDGNFTGILTAARLARGGFTVQEMAALHGLQGALESLLAVTASREENARLKSELQRATERLAGRKQIERAKGIIQVRHGWTEEEAYLYLRGLSRKSRKPMSEIARGVIVHSTPVRSRTAS